MKQAKAPIAACTNLLRVAGKHAWRHRRRTLLVGLCVFLGNLVLIFQLAQGRGQERAFMDNMINSLTGHLAIVRSDGNTEPSLFEAKLQDALALQDIEQLESTVNGEAHVVATARRIRFGAMFSRDEENWNGFIVGAQPEQERKVCAGVWIESGRFVNAGSNEIVISATMARDKGLALGSSVTLLTATTTGSFNAMEFQVVGLLSETGLSKFYSQMAYIPIDRARQLIALDTGLAYELVVRLDHTENTEPVAARLRAKFTTGSGASLKIHTWRDMGGIFIGILELGKAFRVAMAAFLGLIILVLVFSSFSIYVHERRIEIATLLALGLSKAELMLLFVGEGVCIALLGSLAGLAVGGGASYWLGLTGIPAFNEAMTYVFAGDRLYPIVAARDILTLLSGSCVIAAAAALMPVRRSLSQDIVMTLNRT